MAYVDHIAVMPANLRRYAEAVRAGGPFIPPRPAVPSDFAVSPRTAKLPFGECCRYSVDVLAKIVSDVSGFSAMRLASDRRHFDLTRARHIAIWLCHEHTGLSYPQIAKRFGGRDHTSALHAVRRVDHVIGALEMSICSDPTTMTRRLWHVEWPRYRKPGAE